MIRISKIISWVVLVCFLFNTASYDLAFGQTLNYHSNQDKLAAPSELTDITGIQHKDMGRIKLALEERLMSLGSDSLPVKNNLVPILVDEKINFKEKTIFQPADMQFFFHEIKLTNAGPCVMVRLKDKYGLRTYYAAFSLRKDKYGGFPVNIYTEEQYKNTAAFTKGVARIKTEDTEAITRYVENNEKIIDTFIRERINAGDFAEIYNPVAERLLDIKFPDKKKPKLYFEDFLTYAQVDLKEFLNIFSISVFNAFDGKNIVFIKVPRAVSYPVINENGRSITVKSHTSENAVYFFLDNILFEQVKKYNFGQSQYMRIIKGISLETIVHEIGVSYGLPYEVTPDGKIVNDLDKAYEQYKLNPDSEISVRFPRLKNLTQTDLNHVKGRDYAAAAKRDRPANDLGGSSPATLTTSQLKTVLLLWAILKNNLPRGPLTLSGFWLKKIEKDNPQELKQLKKLDPSLLEWARKFYEGQRVQFTFNDQHSELDDYYSAGITLLDIVTNQTQVEDARAALTLGEHKELREWLKNHNARQEKYRRRDLEARFGGVEIYIIPGLPVNGHYAIRDEIVYVSDEIYLAHEVYELLSILKYGYANFGDEITLINFGKRFIAKKIGKPNDLPSLLSWFMEKESKEIRLLERRKEAKDKLIKWLDKTGDDLEVLEVLTDIHNKAPKIPGVKAEAMIEYYSNKLRLPRLALVILEALKNLRDDYILTDTQGLRRAIQVLKERGLFAQSDLLLGKDDSLLAQLSGYYSHVAAFFLSRSSPVIKTPEERNYVLRQLKKVLSESFEDPTRVAVRGAAGDTKAALQKGAVNPVYVYFFGNGETSAEGLFKENLDARKIILGGKGEGLHSMTRAKIPVPPGFTITTDACNYYYAHSQNWPNGLEKEVNSNLAGLEKLLNKKLGDNENPLLVSVRSGAKFSMPGMMDTILNLGLNDATVLIFAHKTGNDRLAWDSYRRFIQMFSDVVLGIEKKDFEKIIESKKEKLGVKQDVELNAEALKDLVVKFKALVASRGKEFPQDVRQQLIMAVNAVFESWNNPRAITYRNLNKIPHDLGTAVNVQAMVFGNTGDRSATGVGFTRNPSTGVKEPYGEFLINAQGEDVVAGTRTPQPVSQLKEAMPEVYSQLMKITNGLEKHYKDMQDFEFTIEDGKLYLLQTRSGKRTGVAAVKVAVDMVKEGLITKEEALMRVDPKQLNEVLFPILDPQAKKSLTSKEILATGLSAGPGAAAGQVVFTAEDAVKWTNEGKKVILWRKETCPDDIAGMDKAIGVGTSIGGMTSHAALVARGMGKVTMVGAGQVDVSYEKKEAYAKNEQGEVIHTLKEGDWITLNVVEKEKAQLILGKKDIVRPEAIGGELEEFLSWAKEASRLRVWANAEIPHDARKAFSFGAEGIGLCRTEHMFFGEDRLPIMQEMILADSTEARESALDKLLPMQREDFIGLFREMKGYPVTIRTLDPPLHEFLPKREELMVEVKELELANADLDLIKEKKKLLSRINELHEFNPMMGMRGTRLGIMMPEITAMQARAIAEAAVAVIKEEGKVVPEIMIPLVGKLEEFTHQKKITIDTVEKVIKESGVHFQYRIGTMIEVPRGALTADELAKEAEFFSFGTNDLTQYGAGFSRDDIGKFMSHYLSLGIYPFDPFETFDAKGIGELVRIAVEKGRKTKPDLKIGVCGEHGGDPESIKFFHEAGLNYVSCSPYRVLGAWLAAAQAAIKERLSKSPALPVKEAAGQDETNIIEKFSDAISRVIKALKENSPGIEEIVFRKDMQLGLVMEFYTPHGKDHIYSKEKQALPYKYEDLQLSFFLFEYLSNGGLIDKFTVEIKQSKEEIAKNLEDAVKEKLSKGPAVETESDGGLNSRVNESQTPAQAAKAPLSVYGGKAQSSEADTSPILTIKQEPQAMQWGYVGIHTITGAKDGSFIAIGGGKQYVDIVDSKTWRTIRRLRFSDWGIWAIDSSPEFLAIGGTTAELRIYRTADLINYHDKPDLLPLTTIQIEYKDLKIEKINAIRFLGGEKQQYLAVGYKAREGYKNGIAILGKTGAQWEIIERFEDYNGENNSLDSSSELFAYGTKKGVTIRKIGSWAKYKDISLKAEEGDLVAPVRFLSNGKYIIGGTTGGEVILWDTAGTFWLRNRYVNGKIRLLVPSPDGRRLLITSGSHEDLSKSSDIIIVNIGGKIFDTFAETKGHNDIVYGALWLDNETFITAAGYLDKHLRKWKIAETPLSPPAAGQSDIAKSAPAALNAKMHRTTVNQHRSLSEQLGHLEKFVSANKGKGSTKGTIEEIYASVYTFLSKTATHPTFGVGVTTKAATGIHDEAQGGTSAGTKEPITLSAKDSYQTKELEVFEKYIKPALLGKNVANALEIDEELERIGRSLKPTPEDPDLIYAGPVITATSMAVTRALARSAGVDEEVVIFYLYNQLAKKEGAPELKEMTLPIYMAKVNDGGVHGATITENRIVEGKEVKVKLPVLPYQEFMFAPMGYNDDIEALKALREVNKRYYQLVKEKYTAVSKEIDDALTKQKTSIAAILKEIEGRNSEPLDVIAEANTTLCNLINKLAIEYGFGAEAAIKSKLLTSNIEILDLMTQAIKDTDAAGVFIVRDDAASELYNHPGKPGLYYLGADAKTYLGSEDGYVTTGQKIQYDKMLIEMFPRIVSIEDGFSEHDTAGWIEGTRQLGDRVLLIGDDVFVTAPELVEIGAKEKWAAGLLNKINQAGTILRALWATIKARAIPVKLHNLLAWLIAESHRSGEPANQDMMAIISVGTNTEFIKTTVGSVLGGGQGREAKVNILSMISAKWRNRGQPLKYAGANILNNPQRGFEKIVKRFTENKIYDAEDAKKFASLTAAEPSGIGDSPSDKVITGEAKPIIKGEDGKNSSAITTNKKLWKMTEGELLQAFEKTRENVKKDISKIEKEREKNGGGLTLYKHSLLDNLFLIEKILSFWIENVEKLTLTGREKLMLIGRKKGKFIQKLIKFSYPIIKDKFGSEVTPAQAERFVKEIIKGMVFYNKSNKSQAESPGTSGKLWKMSEEEFKVVWERAAENAWGTDLRVARLLGENGLPSWDYPLSNKGVKSEEDLIDLLMEYFSYEDIDRDTASRIYDGLLAAAESAAKAPLSASGGEARSSGVDTNPLTLETAKVEAALEKRNKEGESNFPPDILKEDPELFYQVKQLRLAIYSEKDQAIYVWDADGLERAVEGQYKEGNNDEAMISIITIGEDGMPLARLSQGGILFEGNFRKDRRIQLADAMLNPDFKGFAVPPGARKIELFGMSQYIPQMQMDKVVLPDTIIENALPEVLHNNGIYMVYVFDGEKGKFIPTYRGGREEPFSTEDMEYALISMPVLMNKEQIGKFNPDVYHVIREDENEYIGWFYNDVPRELEKQKLKNNQYWQYPGLSAFVQAAANVKKIRAAKPGTVGVTNIDLPDLNGHVAVKNLEKMKELFIEKEDGTFEIKKGNGWDSVKECLKISDKVIEMIMKPIEERGGTLILVGDHGSVDDMTQPNHSFNDVSIFIVDFKNKDIRLVKAKGNAKDTQADVAVTILHILGIEKPIQMTGKSLLPPDYRGSPDRIIWKIILDGFGHTDFDDPNNGFGVAMSEGKMPVIKSLYEQDNFVILKAAGHYAGLRGGRQEDFAPEKIKTRESMLSEVNTYKENRPKIKIAFYDYRAIPEASKVYNYEEGTYELTKSPFLNDKDFVVNILADGTIEVFCLDFSQMGSTEYNTGSLGAGRIVEQSIVSIDKLFIEGKMSTNPAIVNLVKAVKKKGYFHYAATLQEAGVHASLRQLYYLIKYLKDNGVKRFLFDLASDGRDEPGQDGVKRVRQLRAALEYFGISDYVINIRGREIFYDRDNKWDITGGALNELLFGSRRNISVSNPFVQKATALTGAQKEKEKLSKSPAVPAKEAAGQSDIAKSAPAAKKDVKRCPEADKGVEAAYAFFTSERSEVSLEQEIAAMTLLASEAGKLLAPPAERYNLLVTWEFFSNGELQEHRARYADRFDIDTVSGISFKQFVDNIMAKAAGKETKTIVLVPNDLSAGQLERLTKAGIRFIRVDNIGLLQAAMNKDPGREKFQIDTYAAMLLLRRIDGSITADSAIYRLLSFYLKSHFALTDKVAIDDYIIAVINNDIAKLIKGYLSYRPAQPYNVPDYSNVAASLISA